MGQWDALFCTLWLRNRQNQLQSLLTGRWRTWAAAPTSARAIPQVLSYLGQVVVQDACALLSSARADELAAAQAISVHQYLLQNKVFRWGGENRAHRGRGAYAALGHQHWQLGALAK